MKTIWAVALAAMSLGGCAKRATVPATGQSTSFYGTLEPFAADAVYFVMTDRFVNGDPSNDHRQQGGRRRTFDVATPGAPAGQSDNIGYLGGDFRGLAD